ncbi:ABC transporter permease subunit [Microbispora hainanensis]|uniref:ABC transporter permease n=1 Tax=Microbispora hainanensis TaxID=568844 RepID=UPI0033F35EE2
MTVSRRRVRAITRKELHEYRRNAAVVLAMAILPLVFLIQPLIKVFTLPASAATALRHEHALLYMLAVPVLVPAVLAAYAVVGERLQGTLEPVIATPISREELLLGKALAAFIPSIAVAYGVFALFVAIVEIFAQPVVASAFIRGPELLAQLLFTPPLAAWSIWVGIAVSARASDPRTAGQLALLLSLPTVAITTLAAFGVVPATLPTALVLGAVLLLLDLLGWRAASAVVDRERLVTGAT